MNPLIEQLGRRVIAGDHPSRPDFSRLIEASQDDPHDLLYWANRVRQSRFGNRVRMCCIVAGKLGGCAEDCKWCAQSARAKGSAVGPIAPQYATPDRLCEAAREARDCGAEDIGIVNSGRRPSEADIDKVAHGAREIQSRVGGGIRVCCSLGELTPPQAVALKASGIHRYHHNLETSRTFYPRMVTTHTYNDRLRTLAAARSAGLSLCCGGLLGLGETWDDRIELALTLRDEVRPDVVPLNFLHPVAGTALQNQPPMAPLDILRTIAIFRLVLPGADIKTAGGREHNLRDLQSWLFYAGASSIMTGNYLATSGRGSSADLQMIADLGLTVVKDLPS